MITEPTYTTAQIAKALPELARLWNMPFLQLRKLNGKNERAYNGTHLNRKQAVMQIAFNVDVSAAPNELEKLRKELDGAEAVIATLKKEVADGDTNWHGVVYREKTALKKLEQSMREKEHCERQRQELLGTIRQMMNL